MRYVGLIGLLLFGPAMVATATTDVQVIYGHRLINRGHELDPDLIEGGIPTTFVGATPIAAVGDDPRFVQETIYTVTTVLAWNELTLTVDLVDADDDTFQVVAEYTPAMPLNPAEHTLPVFDITTDPANLWDPDIGIYVWGNGENCFQRGDEWERPIAVELLKNGTTEFLEAAGLRIFGQTSRTWEQKSLRTYFDDYGSQAPVYLDLFDGSQVPVQRLAFRTGVHAHALLNSQFAETLFLDLGHLTSRYAPVEVYLNNECWGLYCLHERYDDEYVETTLGIDADYILLKDGEAVVGDLQEWLDVMNSFGDVTDPTDHAWYTTISNALDLDSYIDWQFINIFGASSDNGYDRNRAMLKVAEEPWLFMCWDEDGVLWNQNLNGNHFDLYTAQDAETFEASKPEFFAPMSWGENALRWNRMFHVLMQNSEFKVRFGDRCRDLLAGAMSVDAMQTRIDDLQAGQAPAMPFHDERWSDITHWWIDAFFEQARQWVDGRHDIVSSQLDTFLESYRRDVEVVSFVGEYTADGVSLGWRTESEEHNLGFRVYRGEGQDGPLVMLADYTTDTALIGGGTTEEPRQYAWLDETPPPGVALRYRLAHVDGNELETLISWIVTVQPAGVLDLRLNEFQADNQQTLADEHGEYDDWIELVNTSLMTVSLDSLFLTDDPELVELHRLSGGLSIPPGGRLLLWADGQPEQGDTHLSFRLASSGESLALVAADGSTVIDALTFGRQLTDRVYQRYPDAVGPWTWARDPSPTAVNTAPVLTGLLQINELMPVNVLTIADAVGDYDPWLEIVNPLPIAIDLEGVALTAPAHDHHSLSVPVIAADGHLLLWADDEFDEGDDHVTALLEPGGGSLTLVAADGMDADSVNYPALSGDESFARIPDGGTWIRTFLATPGTANPVSHQPPLVINELLASNQNGIVDETGAAEDWAELFNPGSEPVSLSGLTLTDDVTEPAKWPLPALDLGPGAFLIVWCDDDPEDGPLHATFKLSASGEELALFQGNDLLDHVVFGVQTTDVSYGRQTDAALPWILFAEPTPGSSNQGITQVLADVPRQLQLGTPFPNPFNPRTTVAFMLPRRGHVELSVYDLRGRRVRALVDGEVDAGAHTAVWDGRDDSGRGLPSGTYCLRIAALGDVRSGRALLVR